MAPAAWGLCESIPRRARGPRSPPVPGQQARGQPARPKRPDQPHCRQRQGVSLGWSWLSSPLAPCMRSALPLTLHAGPAPPRTPPPPQRGRRRRVRPQGGAPALQGQDCRHRRRGAGRQHGRHVPGAAGVRGGWRSSVRLQGYFGLWRIKQQKNSSRQRHRDTGHTLPTQCSFNIYLSRLNRRPTAQPPPTAAQPPTARWTSTSAAPSRRRTPSIRGAPTSSS